MSPDKFYLTIKQLPDQCVQAFEEAGRREIPASHSEVQSVVVCGMGGSALGPEIIGDVFGSQLPVPYIVNREYSLPFQANGTTLVMLSSYSGNTEEVLSCGREALEKKAKLLAITTGGKLADFAKENEIPCYQIEPIHNLSGQPRMGLGYSVFGVLGLLVNIQLIRYSVTQLSSLTEYLQTSFTKVEKRATELAKKLEGRLPILIGAEHLKGAVHVFDNLLNESAKTFTSCFYLPELDHDLLEGLAFPRDARETLTFFFADSNLYLPRMRERVGLSREIIEQQNYSVVGIKPRAAGRLTQAMEVVALGMLTSYYLAKQYGVDPSSAEIVEEFKRKLTKHA
ncbi:hypothetical protein KKB83_04445 [Patescibacteria group bacterium]|nr:hypothetical protein [Patescibacteria group bacterium]